jgi:transposase InsO family protein
MQVLEELKQRRGLPRQIRSDNGPEFVSRAVDQAYEQGLQWHTIQQRSCCHLPALMRAFLLATSP